MKQEQLIILFQEIALHHNEVAFQQLFYQCYSGLLSFAKAIVLDSQNAEELVNDVFVKLWESRNLLAAVTHPSHYLYTSVRHACINHMESKVYKTKAQTVYIDNAEESLRWSITDQETQLIHKQTLAIVNTEISALPAKCQLIFRLIRVEGLKYKEVAQLLGLSEKTVEKQMNIAIKKLWKALKNTFQDELYSTRRKNN